MILADTSVWIDYLRGKEERMTGLLEGNELIGHPVVVGELLLGGLKPDSAVIRRLRQFEAMVVPTVEEVERAIEIHALGGRGIGYSDATLLASCIMERGVALWSKDRKLARVAREVGLPPPYSLH